MCVHKHYHLKLIVPIPHKYFSTFLKDILLIKHVMRKKQYIIGSSYLATVILENISKLAAQNCYFCPFKLWGKMWAVGRYEDLFSVRWQVFISLLN